MLIQLDSQGNVYTVKPKSFVMRMKWYLMKLHKILCLLPILLTLLTLLPLQTGAAANDDAQSLSAVYIYRPTDPMTMTQGVKISVDGAYIDKLWHGKIMKLDLEPGKHKFKTSVGLSLGVPNVTGFSGAKASKQTFKIENDAHYYKVKFKPALMGGKHIMTEIDEAEFRSLSENKSEKK